MLFRSIFEEACVQAEELADDRVLVVSSGGWNHGVIGIVASKLVEKYKKPVFIIGERGEEATGSARSFGDFSVADAVRAADDIIIKGGGHGAAAGVTLATEKIGNFRRRVNEFYDSLQLTNQERYLLPRADVEIDDFSEIDEDLVANLAKMEPFGNGNPEPVVKITSSCTIGKTISALSKIAKVSPAAPKISPAPASSSSSRCVRMWAFFFKSLSK